MTRIDLSGEIVLVIVAVRVRILPDLMFVPVKLSSLMIENPAMVLEQKPVNIVCCIAIYHLFTRF